RHTSTLRTLLARYGGAELDTAGDGFFASFEGPGRGIRCALSIVEAVEPLGGEVRAGLHTGEMPRVEHKVGGLAANIGARVAAMAAPSEVLVSQTVKDLMVGSDLAFVDRGSPELEGGPRSVARARRRTRLACATRSQRLVIGAAWRSSSALESGSSSSA